MAHPHLLAARMSQDEFQAFANVAALHERTVSGMLRHLARQAVLDAAAAIDDDAPRRARPGASRPQREQDVGNDAQGSPRGQELAECERELRRCRRREREARGGWNHPEAEIALGLAEGDFHRRARRTSRAGPSDEASEGDPARAC